MEGKVYDDVPEAWSRKPDPKQPWRYESPCCHKMVNGKENSLSGFRCYGCKRKFEMDELYDKKYGEIVGQRSIVGS